MAWLAYNVAVGNSQIFRIDMTALPAWIDMIPVFSGIVTIAGISIKIGRLLQKLDHVIEDVEKIKDELKDHDRRIIILETASRQK